MKQKVKLGEPRSDKTPSQYGASKGEAKRRRMPRIWKRRHRAKIREQKREAKEKKND